MRAGLSFVVKVGGVAPLRVHELYGAAQELQRAVVAATKRGWRPLTQWGDELQGGVLLANVGRAPSQRVTNQAMRGYAAIAAM